VPPAGAQGTFHTAKKCCLQSSGASGGGAHLDVEQCHHAAAVVPAPHLEAAHPVRTGVVKKAVLGYGSTHMAAHAWCSHWPTLVQGRAFSSNKIVVLGICLSRQGNCCLHMPCLPLIMQPAAAGPGCPLATAGPQALMHHRPSCTTGPHAPQAHRPTGPHALV
jgi:hypothetical protein